MKLYLLFSSQGGGGGEGGGGGGGISMWSNEKQITNVCGWVGGERGGIST